MLLVLDLGFGERGFVVDAPVDGAEAFVDETLLEEVVEGFDDAGFVAEGHRQVWVVPATKDAGYARTGSAGGRRIFARTRGRRGGRREGASRVFCDRAARLL